MAVQCTVPCALLALALALLLSAGILASIELWGRSSRSEGHRRSRFAERHMRKKRLWRHHVSSEPPKGMFPKWVQASANRPNGTELFRFAVVTDTHLWSATPGRRAFSERSDAASVRDGLLIGSSPEIQSAVLNDLAKFAATGGAFAVHAGDVVCGGATFRAPSEEYESSLLAAHAAERAALGTWPVHHIPGNHDLHPSKGGLETWKRLFVNQSNTPRAGVAYRSIVRSGWRIVLLDSASDVHVDTDGHGRIGAEQLAWLEVELEQSAARSEQVILVVHDLLVRPTDASGNLVSWLQLPDDMIENSDEVLALFRRYSHVRLSLHGHVHANSITTQGGVAFVSTSSADEYPMQWREVIVRGCEIELRTRSLTVPQKLLEQSISRESGRGEGRNDAKRGLPIDNHVLLRTC